MATRRVSNPLMRVPSSSDVGSDGGDNSSDRSDSGSHHPALAPARNPSWSVPSSGSSVADGVNRKGRASTVSTPPSRDDRKVSLTDSIRRPSLPAAALLSPKRGSSRFGFKTAAEFGRASSRRRVADALRRSSVAHVSVLDRAILEQDSDAVASATTASREPARTPTRSARILNVLASVHPNRRVSNARALRAGKSSSSLLSGSAAVPSGRSASVPTVVSEASFFDNPNLEQAALLVEDALAERPLRVRSSSDLSMMLYWLYYRPALRGFIVAVIVGLHLLALWEPNAGSGEHYHTSFGDLSAPPDASRAITGRWCLVAEVALVLVLVLDMLLKMAAVGGPRNLFNLQGSFSKSSDAVIQFTGVKVHVTRCLRPFLLALYNRELRRWGFLAVKTLPKVLGVFCLICLVIYVFAIIGMLLWTGTAYYEDNPEVDRFQNFNNIGYSALALFVLSSSENYPSIMYPAFTNSPPSSQLSFLFFGGFLLVMLYGLANIMLPILYQSFLRHRQELALRLHISERRALMAAFKALDVDDQGFIDERQWGELVQRLRPSAEPFTAHLMMKELLSMGKHSHPAHAGNPRPETTMLTTPTAQPLSSKKHRRATALASSHTFSAESPAWQVNHLRQAQELAAKQAAAPPPQVAAGGTGVHPGMSMPARRASLTPERGALPSIQEGPKVDILLFFNLPDVIRRRYRRFSHSVPAPILRTLDHPIAKALHVGAAVIISGVVACYPWSQDFVVSFTEVAMFVTAVEVMVLMYLLGKKFFRRRRMLFDFVMVGASVVLWGVQLGSDNDQFSRAFMMTMAARVLHLVAVVPFFRRTVFTVVSISRFMGVALVAMLALMYFFAIMGVDLFHGQFDRLQPAARRLHPVVPSTSSPEFCAGFAAAVAANGGAMELPPSCVASEPAPRLLSPPPANSDVHATFDTFSRAMLALFQVVSTSNWHDVMYQTMFSTNTSWAGVYFVFFYFFAVLVVLNLVVGIFLDAFETMQLESDRLAGARLIHNVLSPYESKAAKMMGTQTEVYKIKGGASRKLSTLSSFISARKRDESQRQQAVPTPHPLPHAGVASAAQPPDPTRGLHMVPPGTRPLSGSRRGRGSGRRLSAVNSWRG